MGWLEHWPWERSAREQALLQENARLRQELELSRMREEDLALHAEGLRRWLMA